MQAVKGAAPDTRQLSYLLLHMENDKALLGKVANVFSVLMKPSHRAALKHAKVVAVCVRPYARDISQLLLRLEFDRAFLEQVVYLGTTHEAISLAL